MKCAICDKEYKSIQALSKHISKHMSKKEYYDLYLKSESDSEGYCLVCNKETKFIGLGIGYRKFCCRSHQVKYQQQNLVSRKSQKLKLKERISRFEKEHDCTQIGKIYKQYGSSWRDHFPIIEISSIEKYVENKYISEIAVYKAESKSKIKIKSKVKFKPKSKSKPKTKPITNNIYKRGHFLNRQFEQENNCTQVGVLIQKYGQGWLSLKLPRIDRNKNVHFISNEYLPLIEEYASKNHSYRSKKEDKLYENVCRVYSGEIIRNSKKIIKPLELDIYIPELKLAIEYNGIKWHCIQNDMSKNYHLNKSLLCRELGIRLIHIYEFESFKTQIELLENLILGQDCYPKNDFNKNNLIKNIPEPEIIYDSERFTVYGAGRLY